MFWVSVYNKEICAVTHLSPWRYEPCNLPNQAKTRTNWVVQHSQACYHYKSTAWPRYTDSYTPKQSSLGEKCLFPGFFLKHGDDDDGDLLWEESKSISHTLIVWLSVSDHKDPQGFGFGTRPLSLQALLAVKKSASLVYCWKHMERWESYLTLRAKNLPPNPM